MKKHTLNCDVVIAGAGPVGLLLAGQLKLAGVSVIVLERLTELNMGIKAGGIKGNSLQLLTHLGLRQRLEAESAKYRDGFASFTNKSADITELSKNRFGADRSAGRFAGHFGGLIFPSGPHFQIPPVIPVPQQVLEQILGTWLEELNVPVLRGHEISNFVQDENGVEVRSVNANGVVIVQGNYLVGCDGGRSTIRKLAGFDFPGTDPLTTGYQAIVAMDNPEILPLGWNATNAGIYNYGAKPGWLFFLEFCGPPADRDAPLSIEELQESLRRVSRKEVTVTRVEASSRFTDNARQVVTYRKGRILLAGDATHIHPPFGGQGLDLGMEDAANLAWKLAAVIHGWAPNGLLDTYTAERHPVAERVLKNTRAQIAIMRPDPYSRAMRELFNDLMQKPGVVQQLGEVLRGHDFRYDMGSNTHPLIGKHVPTLPGIEEAMRWFPRPVLFDLSENSGLRKTAEDWADRVDVRPLTAADNLSALLVRPDGYVAWAIDDEIEASNLIDLRNTLTRWFGAPCS